MGPSLPPRCSHLPSPDSAAHACRLWKLPRALPHNMGHRYLPAGHMVAHQSWLMRVKGAGSSSLKRQTCGHLDTLALLPNQQRKECSKGPAPCQLFLQKTARPQALDSWRKPEQNSCLAALMVSPSCKTPPSPPSPSTPLSNSSQQKTFSPQLSEPQA